MKTIVVSTYALAAASLAASPAFAQGNPALAETNAEGSDIVVTASRSGDGVPVDEVAASLTILDAAALDNRQVRIVSDVLRDVPGVSVNRTGAIGGQTSVRIRGTEGNHVLVLIDGIEAADPYYGEYDFGTLIADPAARIEVLRGQQSALYGSDAIGGVIHYITATGAEQPGLSLRAEGGSFGTFSGAARVAGVSGDLDYAVSATTYLTDGYPTARGGTRNIGSDSVGASAKLIWTPSELFRVTAVGRYSYTAAETNNSEQNPASPLFGFTVDSPGVRFVNEGFYGLLRAEGRSADERFSFALTGQIADTARDGYVNNDVIDYGDRGRRYKASIESSYRFGTGTVQHRLTAALDLEREEFQNLSPFGSQGVRGINNLGLVGQYELTVADRLTLGGSVRYDDNDLFGDPTTYRVQAGYRFGSGTRVRAAYGTGVKNPGFFELFGFIDGSYIGNPNLQPEESEGWEMGVDQTFAGGLGTIGATYFNSTLNGEIFTSFPPPNFVATPGNRTTASEQQGIEVFAQLRPARWLRLDLAYTWLDATENGVEEIRRPEHMASANLTAHTADERLSGTLTVRYNGRMTDDAFTDPSFVPVRVTLDEFVLVNLSAEYRLTHNIALFGRIENALDETYEEVFSFATPGRAFYAGARVRF